MEAREDSMMGVAEEGMVEVAVGMVEVEGMVGVVGEGIAVVVVGTVEDMEVGAAVTKDTQLDEVAEVEVEVVEEVVEDGSTGALMLNMIKKYCNFVL